MLVVIVRPEAHSGNQSERSTEKGEQRQRLRSTENKHHKQASYKGKETRKWQPPQQHQPPQPRRGHSH